MRRVFVVDDDRDIRSVICEVAREEGYTCYSAATAASAKALFRKHSPGEGDLVLCDLRLSEGSGGEVIGGCRKHYKGATLILITGAQLDSEAVDALRGSVDHVLFKPFGLEVLTSIFRGSIFRVPKEEKDVSAGKQEK